MKKVIASVLLLILLSAVTLSACNIEKPEDALMLLGNENGISVQYFVGFDGVSVTVYRAENNKVQITNTNLPAAVDLSLARRKTTVADINGDGRLDLLIAREEDTLNVFYYVLLQNSESYGFSLHEGLSSYPNLGIYNDTLFTIQNTGAFGRRVTSLELGSESELRVYETEIEDISEVINSICKSLFGSYSYTFGRIEEDDAIDIHFGRVKVEDEYCDAYTVYLNDEPYVNIAIGDYGAWYIDKERDGTYARLEYTDTYVIAA